MKQNHLLATIWMILAFLLTIFLVTALINDRAEENIFRKTFNGIHIDSDDYDDYYDDWEDNYMEETGLTAVQNSTESYPAVNIQTLNIHSISLPVDITDTSDDKIYVDFIEGAEKYCLINQANGRLEIKQKENRRPFNFVKGKICLRIPQNALKNLNIDIVSGSLSIENISAEKCNIESVSGSVKVFNCDFKTVDTEAVSGSVKMDGKFEKMSVNAVSGSIKISDDIKLKEKSSFETVSGSVTLRLPKDSDYSLDYTSMSGSFKDDISGNKGRKTGSVHHGSGNPKISVSTMSGSIKIESN